MSQRELRYLSTSCEFDSAQVEKRLRSGKARPEIAVMSGDENDAKDLLLEELRDRLAHLETELAQMSAELDEASTNLANAEVRGRQERERAEWLEAELKVQLEAEIVKLRELDGLRKKFDEAREQLRADREREARRFSEWKGALVAENASLKES